MTERWNLFCRPHPLPLMLEQEARAALARGDVQSAVEAARRLAAAEPDHAGGFFLLGMAAAEAGHVGKAIPLVQAAVERGGGAEPLAQLAKLLSLVRRDGEAAAAAYRALENLPADPLTCDTIGCVLARLGDHESSFVAFRSAVLDAPHNLNYRYNLASACSFTGRTDEARGHYEAILAQDSTNGRAHYALSLLSRQSAHDNHVQRLGTALEAAADPDDALRIRYALAKELEDLGETAASLQHLTTANGMQKTALGYDFAQDEAIFDAVEAVFAEGGPQRMASAGTAAASPIFVVGMPRTGTTLVDRILSSHPDVEAAGELQAMPLAVKQLAAQHQSAAPSRRVLDAETALASARIDLCQLGKAYLARAQAHRKHQKPRFTDKLPANFLYIGYIARALPQARIVCLRRNPMDTIWSNYKNLFASQSTYYAYSYDLMDTARYFARFDRLMALWERLLPGRVLQLSYEELVTEQARETRKLLGHCGLDWDEACLSFHENRTAVATPSAAQVRRPMNRDGLHKWRAYEAALEPARRWLIGQGIPID